LKGWVKALAETYFKKTFKGYNPEQVDAFIISLSDNYENNLKEHDSALRAAEAENARLLEEIAELNMTIESNTANYEAQLAKKQEDYDRLYAEIGEKMVIADTRAAEIVKNAEKEAAFIIAEARINSENEAKAMREQAEAEASRLIESTRSQCAEISAKAEEFRLRQDEMNRTISETEKRFGDALNKLKEGFGGI
jgi:cell division initiation protein